MKTNSQHPVIRTQAYTLMLVLVMVGTTLVILAAALNWCNTNMNLNQRNNQYFATLAAAEASTEKVLSRLAADYQSQGESLVSINLAGYKDLVPTPTESSAWADYAFGDGQGNNNKVYVQRIAAPAFMKLQSQYDGLYGLASSYRVVSNARQVNSPYTITAAVQQDVQLASIPLFQFAIFYSIDLEMNPGPDMIVTGRVHGNANIYMQPVKTLTFLDHVTAVNKIIYNKSALDPSVRDLSASKIVFKAEHDAGVSSISLPVGTNNTPAAVRSILDIPPASESAMSPMGKQRYYNKADMIIIVSNNVVIARTGQFDNFATSFTTNELPFLKLNGSFYNKREAKTVKSIDIDVGKLRAWSMSSTNRLTPILGNDIRALYVADMRTQSSSTEAGVRVKNGQLLPPLGLTVSSPNPIYVQGHYNAPNSVLGLNNTLGTLPASLVGDAITILSTAWVDAASADPIGNRQAANTTINAAFLGGIVSSDGANYSGGVENFPRFLEDWSNDILTYNGSMVVMFNSRQATAPWGGSDVYSPPTRKWAFDVNFLDPTKLPPGTPEARALIRGQWAAIKPNTIPGAP